MPPIYTRENGPPPLERRSINDGVLRKDSGYSQWVIRAAALLALCLSVYLAWISPGAENYAGCGGLEQFDCAHVLKTRWSSWIGVPVSYPAIVVYGTVLGSSLALQASSTRVRQMAQRVLRFASLIAIGASLWFILLLVFVIKTFCIICITCHACSLTISSLVLRPWQQRINRRSQKLRVPRSFLPVAQREAAGHLSDPAPKGSVPDVGLLAMVCVLVLVSGQVLVRPTSLQVDDSTALLDDTIFGADDTRTPERNYTDDGKLSAGDTDQVASGTNSTEPNAADLSLSTTPTEETDVTTTASPASQTYSGSVESDVPGDALSKSTSQTSIRDHTHSSSESSIPFHGDDTRANTERKIAVANGRLVFDVYGNPLLGLPEAEHVVVELFDYTCPGCRRMHHQLEEVRTRYGKQLAIMTLPIPLNKKCNAHVLRTHPTHTNDCRYAQLALAVWHIDPSKFEAYHQWLMEGDSVPSLADAARRAVGLFGEEEVKAAIGDKAVSHRIKRYVKLFGATGKRLPLVMAKETAIRGLPGRTTELFDFFEQRLRLAPIAD